MSQNIPYGTEVKGGMVLEVTISGGVGQVYMPDVVGLSKEKAERIIVIANTTAKIRGYKIPELKGATLLASTYGNREATLLRSYEVRVYKVKK